MWIKNADVYNRTRQVEKKKCYLSHFHNESLIFTFTFDTIYFWHPYYPFRWMWRQWGWNFDFLLDSSSFFLRFPPFSGGNPVDSRVRVSTVVKLSYCPAGYFAGTGEPLFVSRTTPGRSKSTRVFGWLVLKLPESTSSQRIFFSLFGRRKYIYSSSFVCEKFYSLSEQIKIATLIYDNV